jgi:hypothetical protein
VNQFGTPVNQFGTPQPYGTPQQLAGPQQLGTPPGAPTSQWGAPQPFAAGGYGQWQPPATKRRSPAQLAVLISLLCVAAVLAVNFGLRYAFPDLSEPIELPGTVSGLGPVSPAAGQPVTIQSKDTAGHATAVGYYADDAARPQAVVTVLAGRRTDLNTDQITQSSSTTGKITCTDNLDARTLVNHAGIGGAAGAMMRGMSSGAACWRTSRNLSVLVVTLRADSSAQSTARQAVQEAWEAI